jgi:glucose dehydrogenase
MVRYRRRLGARSRVRAAYRKRQPRLLRRQRLGDNRYANSIVALRFNREVVWHFQTVHHDLWDYDNASPPALVTIVRDGRRIDVVLQATKTGQLFVLDRDTGKPIFPSRASGSSEHRLRGTRIDDAAVQYGASATQPSAPCSR